MGEETAFENGRISDFQGLVTLTLDWVILSCITRRPVPTYQISLKSNFLWTGRRTFETDGIRSTQRSRPNKLLLANVQDWRSTLTYCQLQTPVTKKLWQKSGPGKL